MSTLLQNTGRNILVKTSWLILAALYAYQFMLIYKYSVDIPFKDEWVYVKPGHPLCLPENLNLSWLFTRIAEHNIVVTNLMMWVNYKVFALDYFIQKICNYLLFGIILLALIRLKNILIGSDKFRMFPCFLFFLLSPAAVENHSWAYGVSTHIVLIFFVLLLISMTGNRASTTTTALFLFFSFMAVYSFAAGVIMVSVCLLYRNIRLIYAASENPKTKRAYYLNAAFSTIIISGIIVYWVKGYEKPTFIPARTWPNEAAFWDYFLNLLSFGFGVDTYNVLPGLFFLLLAIIPLVLFLIDKNKRLSSEAICLSAAIVAILAVLASISFGRASIGDAKTSRYVELGFMLIPFIAMAWWLLIKHSLARNLVLLLLWVSCFCGYLDNWSSALYLETYESDTATLDCVNNYYAFGGDAVCQDFWITPAHLEKARQLQISFTDHYGLRNKLP